MKKAALQVVCTITVLAFLFGTSMAGTEGPYDTFYGAGTGAQTTTGTSNTFIGAYAGYGNKSGGDNVFVGRLAGYVNDSGWGNVFIGHSAGAENISGYANTFVGAEVASNNTTGIYNCFFGIAAGYSNESGGMNTYIGYYAGWGNISGGRNVFIGSEAGKTETGSHKLYIDNCYTGGECSVPLIYGEFDNRIVEINGKLLFASDERLKKNIEPLNSSLDRVMKLRGVSYEWKSPEKRGKGRNIGLIAQDVEVVIPELVVTDNKGYKALSYDKMVPVLVEAIKEQQKMIAEKSRVVDEQQKDIHELKKALAELSALINKLKSSDMTAQK
jgi:trimeric autotransporter adhesin